MNPQQFLSRFYHLFMTTLLVNKLFLMYDNETYLLTFIHLFGLVLIQRTSPIVLTYMAIKPMKIKMVLLKKNY